MTYEAKYINGINMLYNYENVTHNEFKPHVSCLILRIKATHVQWPIQPKWSYPTKILFKHFHASLEVDDYTLCNFLTQHRSTAATRSL